MLTFTYGDTSNNLLGIATYIKVSIYAWTITRRNKKSGHRPLQVYTEVDLQWMNSTLRILKFHQNFHSSRLVVTCLNNCYKVYHAFVLSQHQGRDSCLPKSETDKNILSSTFWAKALCLERPFFLPTLQTKGLCSKRRG